MSTHHKASPLISLGRVVSYALKNFWRNFGLSAITISILVVTMLSVNVLLLVNIVTTAGVKAVQEQIDVTIFFKVDASEKRLEEVQSFVKSFPEVKSIIFKTTDQVLAEFKERHKGEPELLSAVTELNQNPLGATLVFTTEGAAEYQKVFKALAIPEYDAIIENKTFTDHSKAIERINLITQRIEKFGFILTLLFVFIAFLIIFNTIRVAIYTQREEIQIKKLVGATNWFVRGPFLLEALLYTIIAVAIVVGLTVWAARLIDPYLGPLFTNGGALLHDYFVRRGWRVFGTEALAVFLLTVFSSYAAVRRYLKV
ncbi:MAG: hypothetical protein HW383_433 [Candidatus Magasanikbacteria bacterium]|nr:hypothetical protein [Candidatus Magasanikbacteria bacterium]